MSLDNFMILGKDINVSVWISMFLFLGTASYFDVKTRKIPNKVILAFLIVRFSLFFVAPIELNHILGFIFGYLIIFIPAFIANKPMGGDMKAMAAIGLGVGMYNLLPFLIITLVISYIYYGQLYLRKQKFKDIPFALFYFLGLGIFFIVSMIR